MDSEKGSTKKMGGLLVRKDRWGLSWSGWLALMLLGLGGAYFLFINIHPFLAVTYRVDSKVLVVEGWIQRYAFRAAAEEFKNGRYERIFTTGGPETGSGGYINDYQTMASAGAEALKKLGVPEDVIQIAPSHVNDRERTYSSAVALRDWFQDHGMTVQTINVLTEDCHARRTWLLYREAFGKDVMVGVISVHNPDYEPKYWWRYSDGVREVIGESIAYIYAKFLFHPSAPSHSQDTRQASWPYQVNGLFLQSASPARKPNVMSSDLNNTEVRSTDAEIVFA